MLFIPPLKAEILYEVSGWPITNSLVNAVLVTVLLAVFAYFLNLGIKILFKNKAPKGVLNFLKRFWNFAGLH